VPSGLLGTQTLVFYRQSMAISFHGTADAFAVEKITQIKNNYVGSNSII